ncbi:MAG: hypothetical protein NVV57_00115 [Demequina sp.]|nr:hypothetical protein [Demequina sp.]
MKTAKIAVTALGAILLLAGCSGSSGDESSDAPKPSTTPTAIAEGDGSSPVPSVGNLDDPLCAAALDNITDATNLESQTSDLSEMIQDPTFLTGDAAKLNQWGDDMLELTSSTKDFYVLAIKETQGEDVNADFVALSDFVEKYSIAMAKAASAAGSPAEFLTTIQTLYSADDVKAASEAAPQAAQNAAEYLSTRCGIES